MKSRRPDHCPECGCVLKQTKPSRRSVPQHRRYFAMIKAAYFHWPEKHRLKPTCEEHLRKWLQAKAGHRITKQIDTRNMQTEDAIVAIAAELRNADPYAVKEAVDGRFYIIESKSINFDALSHLNACALFDEVADVIEAETDLKINDIMPPVRMRG